MNYFLYCNVILFECRCAQHTWIIFYRYNLSSQLCSTLIYKSNIGGLFINSFLFQIEMYCFFIFREARLRFRLYVVWVWGCELLPPFSYELAKLCWLLLRDEPSECCFCAEDDKTERWIWLASAVSNPSLLTLASSLSNIMLISLLLS